MNKKGVSPVIAVLLLIVIAVAAAVLTYVWLVGYIGSLQSTGQEQQLQERIKIEAVSVTAGTADITVYVRNIGDPRVVISAVYVLKGSTVIGEKTGLSEELQSGDATSISFTATENFEAGTTYTVKVVTEKGTEASYTFTVPRS